MKHVIKIVIVFELPDLITLAYYALSEKAEDGLVPQGGDGLAS